MWPRPIFLDKLTSDHHDRAVLSYKDTLVLVSVFDNETMTHGGGQLDFFSNITKGTGQGQCQQVHVSFQFDGCYSKIRQYDQKKRLTRLA